MSREFIPRLIYIRCLLLMMTIKVHSTYFLLSVFSLFSFFFVPFVLLLNYSIWHVFLPIHGSTISKWGVKCGEKMYEKMVSREKENEKCLSWFLRENSNVLPAFLFGHNVLIVILWMIAACNDILHFTFEYQESIITDKTVRRPRD